MPNLLRVLALLLIGWSLASCQSLTNFLNHENPSARITNISLSGISPTGADLVFDIHVENPYDVPLPLTRLGYSLSSDGKAFLAGDAPLTGSIPARGSQDLRIPAKLQFAELFSILPGFRLGASIPYDATLDLSLNAPAVGPMRIPLTQTGQLTIPKP
ncbi:MAG: LEA type 2 family protein [Phycisphaeraceae bacterium]